MTRCDQLEDLVGLALAVQGTREPEQIAHALLAFATAVDLGRRGAVLAGPPGSLALLATSGLDPVRRPTGRAGTSPSVARAQDARSALRLPGPDPVTDPWLAALLPDARDLVVVPLVADGRPLGALVLAPSPAPGARLADPAELGLLEQAAALSALALRTTWDLEQVHRLAATDGLTKIANRRTFEQTLERELARAARSGEPLSLVLLDVDHFKRLNDTLGHQAGDDVLRNVAAALSCECRDFDTAARYGGEEFAVVLPGCSPQEAVPIAERLRRAVSAAPAPTPVTASAGIACFPVHGGDVEALVRSADAALYAAKAAGRDRTMLAALRTAARGGLIAVP
ncbi:MAG: GGDEF domain-containing protein [Actinomycetota bacterium]|nr:GGDEF domain-containing protein [Actinomycetota bacterium]